MTEPIPRDPHRHGRRRRLVWTAPLSALLMMTLSGSLVGALTGCGSDSAPSSSSATSAANDPVPGWRAQGKQLLQTANAGAVTCTGHAMTCAGAPLPKAALLNFNPTNSGYKQVTTLAQLSDRPKVVAMLAAW